MMKKFFISAIILFSLISSAQAKMIIDKDCSFLGEKGYFDFANQTCACKDGYIYTKNNLGIKICQEANEYCVENFGASHYDSGNNECSCDEGYSYSSKKKQCILDEYKDINYSKYENIPDFLVANIQDDYQISYRVNGNGDNLKCKDDSQTLVFGIEKDNSGKIVGLTIDCIDVSEKANVDFGDIKNEKFFANQNLYLMSSTLDYQSFFVINGDEWYYIDNGVQFSNTGSSDQKIKMNIGSSFLDENKKTKYIDPQEKISLNIYPYYGDGYFGLEPLSTYINMIYDKKDPMYTNQYYIGAQDIDKVRNKYQNLTGITVAVIDEGVGFIDNDDLKNEIRINNKEIPDNNIDDDNNGYVDDYYGRNFIKGSNNMVPYGDHGTNVSGIIAAEHGNSYGIKGISANSKIMSLIACDKEQCPAEKITQAMKYAVDNGAKVINLSLGGSEFSYDKFFDDAIQYANAKGAIVVSSAGNGSFATQLGVSNQGLDTGLFKVSPACNDINNDFDLIGVGALDNAGEISQWSNYGKCVDFRSFGEKIFTNNLYGYEAFSQEAGTSFSAPQISGIIALGLGINPNLTAEQIYEALKQSTDGYIINALDFMNYINKNFKNFYPKSSIAVSQAANNEDTSKAVKTNPILLNKEYKQIVDKKIENFFEKIDQMDEVKKSSKLGYILGKIDEKIDNQGTQDVKLILEYLKNEIEYKYFK